MGVLDASMVFFLPLGIDFVVVLMTARRPELFWLYALLATVGSVGGAAGTFWVGKQAGERGLTRFVSVRRLRRVKARVQRGTFVVAALALIPPPFPFTPFGTSRAARSASAPGRSSAPSRPRGRRGSGSRRPWRRTTAARFSAG